jgi:hypothetical protein
MKREPLYAAIISALAFVSGIALSLHWLSQGQAGTARFDLFGNTFEVTLSAPDLAEILGDAEQRVIVKSLVEAELGMYELGPKLVQRLETVAPGEPFGRQLRSMRDSFKGPFREEPVTLTAQVVQPGNAQRGMAVVCANSPLTNRYALVRDPDSERLVQVFAQSVMPCQENEQRMTLSNLDAQDLQWSEERRQRAVSVLVAPPGYRFNIF